MQLQCCHCHQNVKPDDQTYSILVDETGSEVCSQRDQDLPHQLLVGRIPAIFLDYQMIMDVADQATNFENKSYTMEERERLVTYISRCGNPHRTNLERMALSRWYRLGIFDGQMAAEDREAIQALQQTLNWSR